MASSLLLPLSCFLFALSSSLLHSPSLASTFKVGGAAGWTLPSQAKLNYDQWSASSTFRVGDYLEFDYQKKSHSLLEVTRSNYRYCNTTNPFVEYDDGKTVIELSKKGSYYFICGIPGHCEAGQKFQAKVLDSIDSPAFEPALAPAPAPTGGAIPPVAAAPTVRISTATAMLLSVLAGATYLMV